MTGPFRCCVRKSQASAGYRHIQDLEQRFADELGQDYEAARRVLERVAEILAEA